MADYPPFVLLDDTLKLYDAYKYYRESPPLAEGAVSAMTCLKPGSVFVSNITEEDQALYCEMLEIISKQVYMQRIVSVLKAVANRTTFIPLI